MRTRARGEVGGHGAQQRGSRQEPLDLFDLPLAADETRQLAREIGGVGSERLKRREVGLEVRVHHRPWPAGNQPAPAPARAHAAPEGDL